MPTWPTWAVPPEGLEALLWLGQALQRGGLALLHALGLVGDLQGQPRWPWGLRLAAEPLLAEPAHARAVLTCLAALAAAAVLGLVGLAAGPWRRARGALLGAAALLLALAPWPPAHLLWAPAVPTSFHRSPTGFGAPQIARGQALYQQHCLECHGDDGRGNSAQAARLPLWPPDLSAGLLWRRLEGELFWRIQQGLHDRNGQATMPGFRDRLSAEDTWAVLDYLQAQAAGQTLQARGAWEWPVPLPAMRWTCRDGQPRDSQPLRGQRMRLVFLRPGEAPPLDDPRLLTVVAGAGPAQDPECRVDDPRALQAMAHVLGVPLDGLAGHQVLVDRQGWMRARTRPGESGWSASSLVCQTRRDVPERTALSMAQGDALEAVIRRMDADPLRPVRGGLPH